MFGGLLGLGSGQRSSTHQACGSAVGGVKTPAWCPTVYAGHAFSHSELHLVCRSMGLFMDGNTLASSGTGRLASQGQSTNLSHAFILLPSTALSGQNTSFMRMQRMPAHPVHPQLVSKWMASSGSCANSNRVCMPFGIPSPHKQYHLQLPACGTQGQQILGAGPKDITHWMSATEQGFLCRV